MTNPDEPLDYFELMRRNLEQIKENMQLINQGTADTLEGIQKLINENATRADQDKPKSN